MLSSTLARGLCSRGAELDQGEAGAGEDVMGHSNPRALLRSDEGKA